MSSMEVIIRVDGKEHKRLMVWPAATEGRYLASEVPSGTERMTALGLIDHPREDGTMRLAQRVIEASIEHERHSGDCRKCPDAPRCPGPCAAWNHRHMPGEMQPMSGEVAEAYHRRYRDG